MKTFIRICFRLFGLMWRSGAMYLGVVLFAYLGPDHELYFPSVGLFLLLLGITMLLDAARSLARMVAKTALPLFEEMVKEELGLQNTERSQT